MQPEATRRFADIAGTIVQHPLDVLPLRARQGRREVVGRNVRLPALRARLINTAAELLPSDELRPVIDIDAETPLRLLTGLEVKGLMRFEPCGQGNRKPVLLSRGVRVAKSKVIGSTGEHLRLTVKDGPLTWPAIAFRQAEADTSGDVDIVYSLTREWGREGIELEILDIAPSALRRPLEYPR